MIAAIYPLIEEYAEIQQRLIALLKERVGADQDWEYLIGVPKVGTVALDKREWRFRKHGAGVTFVNDEGIVVHAHTGMNERSDLFDAWRLGEYLRSKGVSAILFKGAERPNDFASVSDMLKLLAQSGAIRRFGRADAEVYHLKSRQLRGRWMEEHGHDPVHLPDGNDGGRRMAGREACPTCRRRLPMRDPIASALPKVEYHSLKRSEKVRPMSTAVSPSYAKQTTVTRGCQSRFGLAWLIGCLCIAAWSALWSPSRPVKPASSAAAIAGRAAESPAEPRCELRMKPIHDYRVGERFIAINPLGGEEQPEPDVATWKSVKMRLRKPSGRYVTMELLLSPQAMDALGVKRSSAVSLELPEMGIGGVADVLSIGPCPEIEPGEGSVVTGVFVQESEGDLVNVYLEGIEEPIGVTDNHPFFSLERGGFIRAGELRSGERLSSADELTSARVSHIERRPGDELVYNLQVNGQHVYHVASSGILVHNSCVNEALKIQQEIGGNYLEGEPCKRKQSGSARRASNWDHTRVSRELSLPCAGRQDAKRCDDAVRSRLWQRH